MMGMTPDDYSLLTEAWRLSLRSQNKSPRTIRGYMTATRLFAGWCEQQGGEPDLSRRAVEAFVASLLDGGKASTTAAQRQIALRQFSAWLASEGEIKRDELAGLKAPKIDQRVVEHLTPDQMRALLAACAGTRFTNIRDLALVRFMHSTGARSDEVVSMKTYDIQVAAHSCVIVRGKGGKGRRSGYGDKTAEALVRYLRARRKHPAAERDDLWLAWANGRRSDPNSARGNLTYEGLSQALLRRAEAAGIEGFHLHRLRHTGAVDWLRRGGTVSGLMSQFGWTSIDMVRRYVAAAESDLAVDEAHRLAVDDF
jgi:site-specific recombinase XerD